MDQLLRFQPFKGDPLEAVDDEVPDIRAASGINPHRPFDEGLEDASHSVELAGVMFRSLSSGSCRPNEVLSIF